MKIFTKRCCYFFIFTFLLCSTSKSETLPFISLLLKGDIGPEINEFTIEPPMIYLANTCSVKFEVEGQGESGHIVINEINENGSIIGDNIFLSDDGSNGDVVANDNIYSSIEEVPCAEKQVKFYRYKFGKNKYSYGKIVVTTKITDSEVDSMSRLATISDDLSIKVKSGDIDYSLASATIISELSNDANVDTYGHDENNEMVWWFVDSILNVFHYSKPEASPLGPSLLNTYSAGDAIEKQSSKSLENFKYPHNNKVLYLAPYLWQTVVSEESGLVNYDPGSRIRGKFISKGFSFSGVANANRFDGDLTPEVLKTFKDYGIIHLTTHGQKFSRKEICPNINKYYGHNVSFCSVYATENDSSVRIAFALGDLSDDDLKSWVKKYEKELKLGHFYISGRSFMVTPFFFYSQKYKDTMMYGSICWGAYNDSMSYSFLSSGASSYFGYNSPVSFSYNLSSVVSVYNELLSGKSTGEVSLIDVPFTQSGGSRVRLRLHGDKNFKIIRPSPVINNGSFENGDLDGWTVDDVATPFVPVQVATKGAQVASHANGSFFEIDPTDGKYAFIHGFDGSAGDISISQTISLPKDRLVLKFDYMAGWEYRVGENPQARVFSVQVFEFDSGHWTLSLDKTILKASPNKSVVRYANRGEVDLSQFAGKNVKLVFNFIIPEHFTGPGLFQLDNVRLD